MLKYTCSAGSSPLARGTRSQKFGARPALRFIPAGAGNTRRAARTPPARPVHPRWRGEHPSGIGRLGSLIGSSPLARGTPLDVDLVRPPVRFIPAGAGNTASSAAGSSALSVHPRWRGEHRMHWYQGVRDDGSSPLARGTQLQAAHSHERLRFIPAGAGNTTCPPSCMSWATVHPRWRGEHPSSRKAAGRWGGSSPLARGTHRPRQRRSRHGRFIPAGAGNTGAPARLACLRSVHPRWRGEHDTHALSDAIKFGSSPLARGTRARHLLAVALVRFIPAGAGNTTARASPPSLPPVHPRWRGEHPKAPPIGTASAGSSPLARGTRHADALRLAADRFIPAGAGNTSRSCPWSTATTVHPRWRGEHYRIAARSRPAGGSSPLARGTQVQARLHVAGARFIPAGAGNTSEIRNSRGWTPVHPRWRGEHLRSRKGLPPRAGSSPLARGTPVRIGPAHRARRFIPAGAGNTPASTTRQAPWPVHPRWRGEHRGADDYNGQKDGSSPLARGTHVAEARCLARHRFIPAGAGNTSVPAASAAQTSVHPRWRGEHRTAWISSVSSGGSSPLARGTLRAPVQQAARGRFIPAGAGNTHSKMPAPFSQTVHPRWRGEHIDAGYLTDYRIGSSPLARGTQRHTRRRQALGRFIPAGAGNTCPSPSPPARPSVHPRWRGEHTNCKPLSRKENSECHQPTEICSLLRSRIRRHESHQSQSVMIHRLAPAGT